MERTYQVVKKSLVTFKLDFCCWLAPIRVGIFIIAYLNILISVSKLFYYFISINSIFRFDTGRLHGGEAITQDGRLTTFLPRHAPSASSREEMKV